MENAKPEILALFLFPQNLIFQWHTTWHSKQNLMKCITASLKVMLQCEAVPLLCPQQRVLFPAAVVAWAMGPGIPLLQGHGKALPCLWPSWDRCPFLSLKALACVLGTIPKAHNDRHRHGRAEVLGICFNSLAMPLSPAVLNHRWPCRQPATLGNKPCQLCCSPYLPYLHYCMAAYKESLTSKESQATAKCFHL